MLVLRCLGRTRQKSKVYRDSGIERRFVQGLQQMDLPSNTGPMVLQLCVGLGHWIFPQHLHDDCDDLLSDTGLRDLISFPMFLGSSGVFLVGEGWVLGKVLVKRFRIQPIENYISSE